MEKRLLLVFALTFVVVLLFQPILKKYFSQPASTPQTQQVQQAPATTGNQSGSRQRSRDIDDSGATRSGNSTGHQAGGIGIRNRN